jgi:hypothetical protein
MPRGVYKRSPRSAEHKANLSAAWTEERRKAQSERQTGTKHSPETKKKISESNKIRMTNEERQRISDRNTAYWTDERRAQHSLRQNPVGFSYDSDGYKILTGQRGHPLAHKGKGTVREHRKVLFDDIGPGPHECYWNPQSGCGQMSLGWDEITVDHLNGVIVDNRIENLVPSCKRCNVLRSKAGNPIDWDGKTKVRMKE